MKIERGTRVRLVACADRFTHLRAGDMGTVLSCRIDPWGDLVVSVAWDSGSTLRLIEGEDTWEEVRA